MQNFIHKAYDPLIIQKDENMMLFGRQDVPLNSKPGQYMYTKEALESLELQQGDINWKGYVNKEEKIEEKVYFEEDTMLQQGKTVIFVKPDDERILKMFSLKKQIKQQMTNVQKAIDEFMKLKNLINPYRSKDNLHILGIGNYINLNRALQKLIYKQPQPPTQAPQPTIIDLDQSPQLDVIIDLDKMDIIDVDQQINIQPDQNQLKRMREERKRKIVWGQKKKYQGGWENMERVRFSREGSKQEVPFTVGLGIKELKKKSQESSEREIENVNNQNLKRWPENSFKQEYYHPQQNRIVEFIDRSKEEKTQKRDRDANYVYEWFCGKRLLQD